MASAIDKFTRTGQLCVEGVEHDVRYAPLQFDGWHERHWTLPFSGERYSLVWFTPAEAAARTSADARAAEVLGNRDFRYRENSSDALAILEVLGCVEINQCVGCTRQFFTKSFLGNEAAVMARSSCEEPAPPRHRASVASMAWRTAR